MLESGATQWRLVLIRTLRSLGANKEVIENALALPPDRGPILAASSWTSAYIEPEEIPTLLKQGGWFFIPATRLTRL